jgi:hypothetical protein
MNDFCLGQRVLCIDGKFHPSVWEFVNEVPIEGEVYTIRFIRNGPEKITGIHGPALALEEISGRLPGCKTEVCWIVRRFVPLDVAETNSVAKKRRSVAKKKRAPQPRRKKPEPALV